MICGTGAISNGRCAWPRQLLSVTAGIARAPRLTRQCKVGGCVDMVQIMSQESIEDKIVDELMPQIGADCRCAGAPVARRARGADFGFHSPSLKEKLVEVIQPLHQGCIQQRLRKRWWKSRYRQSKRSSRKPLPQEHLHKHIVEQTVAFCVTEQNENRGGVSASAARAHPRGIPGATEQRENHGNASGSVSRAHPRAHRGPELPKKCRHRKRQIGKPSRDNENELLEAATARARDEEDEFLQAVPQDETMKVRRTEVHVRKHPGKLGQLVRNEGVS